MRELWYQLDFVPSFPYFYGRLLKSDFFGPVAAQPGIRATHRHSPGEHLDVRTLGAPKILYCLGGEGLLSPEDGPPFSVAAGDAIVLQNARRRLRYTSRDPKRALCMHLLAIFFERREGGQSPASSRVSDLALEEYLRNTFPENRHVPAHGSYFLWELASRIRTECESRQFLSGLFACELAKQFALRVAQQAGIYPGIELPKRLGLVQKACDAVLSDPFLELRHRQAMADKLGVSITTLSRTFSECVGMPYSRYLDRIRIEHAKYLLLDSHLPVSRVARLFHFTSAGAFTRAFKAATGLTPKSYRNSYDGTPMTWNNRARRDPGLHPRLPRRETGEETWEIIDLPAELPLGERSLFLCLEGEFALAAGGTETVLRPGDRGAVLAAKGETVQGRPIKPRGTARALVVQGGSIGSVPEGMGKGARKRGRNIVALPRQKGLLAVELQSLSDLLLLRAWIAAHPRTASGPEHAHAVQMVRSLCRILWIQAVRGAAVPRETAPAPPPPAVSSHRLLLSHARNFMQKHCQNPLTLNGIAWAAGVSAEHLARVFRAETGRTVMEELQAIRVSRAQSLLVKSDKSVSDISELAGFSTAPLFCRVFKRHAGCTPGIFRLRGIGALP